MDYYFFLKYHEREKKGKYLAKKGIKKNRNREKEEKEEKQILLVNLDPKKDKTSQRLDRRNKNHTVFPFVCAF